MCGITGVIDASGYAAKKAVSLLAKMQNRGPQGACVIYGGAGQLHDEMRGAGSVETVFDGSHKLDCKRGSFAVGQVRYATVGDPSEACQPFLWQQHGRSAALTHNGELANAGSLRAHALRRWGYECKSSSDTEAIIPWLMHMPGEDFKAKLLGVLQHCLEGAFSLVILYEGRLYCARDQHGFRPLAIGRGDGVHIAASESGAIDMLDAEYIRDVDAGELVVIGSDGIEEAIQWAGPRQRQSCVFEFIYFAGPDSNFEGISVSRARNRMGRNAFAESGWIDADVIVPVFDSGVESAFGFHRAMEEQALREGRQPAEVPEMHAAVSRSWFVGRSFQESDQAAREMLQRIKSNVIRTWVEGKRVIVVDDSIVRGTVMKTIIRLMRLAGAREVHVVIPSPPPKAPCPYGIDTYEDELVAACFGGDIAQIRDYIGADSLRYLSQGGLLQAVAGAGKPGVRTPKDFCTSCFTGRYPVAFEQDRSKKPQKAGAFAVLSS
ncbi:MAG: amidophosphoribosyltransferase [Candidatus Sungbacteria bacterium]|nr:amidophosphoribosyltransferase [Candidatus Sungbacteria bacterium]